MNKIRPCAQCATPPATPDHEWLTLNSNRDGSGTTLRDRIENAGDRHPFPALFDLDGNLVPATRIQTRTSHSWRLLGHEEQPAWIREPRVGTTSSRRRRFAERGYTVGVVLAPAKVKVDYPGAGVGGARGIHQYIVRDDGGFSFDVEVICTGH